MSEWGRGAWAFVAVVCLAACGGPAADDGGIDAGATDGGHVDAPATTCTADTDCDDGLFCDGVERCAPGTAGAAANGCVAGGGDPCTTTAGRTCSEPMRRCLTACDVSGDSDGDGHAAIECGGDDCDDANAQRYPGNTEVCDVGDVDEDCDAATFGTRDIDGDGYVSSACCNGSGATRACGNDCDDLSAGVSPVGTEVCDGRDNDCDGIVDDGVTVSGFADADGDLHGDPAMAQQGCPGAAHFSTTNDDCDDTRPSVYGGQVEVCDGLDNDCDGLVDDGTLSVTWYRDADGDGFGTTAATMTSCAPPPGYALLPFDCDDTDATVSPGAVELCNGHDDDCNGRADYRVAPGDFEDDDADGAVDARCTGGTDCDDRNPDIHPGAPEVCDGLDDDCNGAIDEGAASVTWYVDADHDTYGDSSASTMSSCTPPAGYAARGGDCDDANAARHPGAPDVCDGIDEDCSGTPDTGPAARCVAPHGAATCTAGACVVGTCEAAYADCDTTPSNGCETDTATDPLHCGGCAAPACPARSAATATCNAGACSFTCAAGFGDCDTSATNGCEADLATDPRNCTTCGNRCAARPNADPACGASGCGVACHAGFTDCDGVASTGCEVDTDGDAANCGSCGHVCPGSTDLCARGSCFPPPFPSDGSGGAFAPAADVVISAGIHRYTTIDIPAGVHVTTSGSGVLELYASGDVNIAGTIDVSGAAGGVGVLVAGCATPGNGGGGAAGNPLGVTPGTTTLPTCALGGSGGLGSGGSNAMGPGLQCGAGGFFGGGAGGGGTTGAASGGGGGGYAGGGGGATTGLGRPGGAGASVSTTSTGGAGGISSGGAGGGGESGTFYGGVDGAVNLACGPGGGGGGAIGHDAAADLAVSTTFRPGSGGGGSPGAGCVGGNGGGGGGGAVRIASATTIVIAATGVIRADGGAGGGLSSAGAGGGSGGVVFLSAPSIDSLGTVSAVGGAGGLGGSTCARGGAGGLGRIRLSTLPEHCSLGGTFSPPLAAACAVTAPAVDGRAFIDVFPF